MTDHTPQAAAGPVSTGQEDQAAPRPPRTSWVVRVGLLLRVVALIALLVVALLRHQQTLAIGAALARGDAPPAPAVTLPAFDGPPISLAALRGTP